jgi:UDP-N-acetylmuramoyl-tripeptide--D-alanyl-D-alanine ligase
MKLNLRDVAAAANAVSSTAQGFVSGFSIDSRTVEPGDLFFAIKGENFDGHRFIPDVVAKGAAAVVSSEAGAASQSTSGVIHVDDTVSALQRVATWARRQWGGTVVAVTGSAGKTTTKDVIHALLASKLAAGKTTGNFNNHIGLPLSILRLPEEIRIAVLEVGMNHAGEIAALARIAEPNIGVVTNAGYAHIENFESVDGIAAAKRELIEALPDDGVAVLNADDDRVSAFPFSGRRVTFGLSEGADVRAEDVEIHDGGSRFRVGPVRFETSLLGRHGVRNVLAGIAVAQILNVDITDLRDAVRGLTAGKMRGERLQHHGITVINDCYNSNPDAARSMIDVLRDTPARRRIAVLGEMLELGRWAEPLHRDIGRYVTQCGISVLIGIRGAAKSMVDGAIEAGHAVDAAYFFSTPEEAGELARRIAEPGDAILFKGSRGTRVERALEAFLA